ncbi:hypothetical protein [Spartinivicinus ruber]|uniref:hypothetical protein n=1 Tax=Spartinivicinus ruber TaxID=2683272 RepID=UPI0013D272E1|nr:hypothetical protein [Spartinivicinus ruber]
MTKDTKLPEKWQQEKKALKAVQVAFDLGAEIQLQIRREAVDRGINPSDRVRQILGLPVHRKPQRLRLSISLTEDDFLFLAEKFNLDPGNKVEIKHLAAELLVEHVAKPKSE